MPHLQQVKTIVMMLDTSGSMTNNSYGENRLAMLKNGMNAFWLAITLS